VLLLSLVAVGCFAGQALATQQDPSTGNIEVCKASAAAPLAVTGLFNFTITDSHGSTYHVSVPASAAGASLNCTGPIAVASGPATVVESGNPWSAVTSIADLPGASTVSGVNLATGTATVAVTAGSDASHTATVVYTDQLVTGVVEVCKSAVAGSGLTGTYAFSITGADGFSASTGPVPIGACSTAITVPAGSVTVQEGPLPVDVTAISATSQNSNVLNSNGTSLATGTAVVSVQAGDATKQSLVNFTDDVTTLKLCKAWDGPATTTGPYPFTFGVSGVAGPDGPTAGLSLAAGTVAAPNCVIVGQYRAGTQVTVTEGVVPGTKVESISVNPSGNAVPGSISTTNRTVNVSMGAGETVVTYVDEPATPGTLKICKAGGLPVPRGTSFNFSVTGVAGTIAVPLNSCVVVGGSLTPTQFPFNSTLTIVEAPSTGNSVFSIGVVGTTVAGSSNTATGTVQVVIGENLTTEVTYTNIDPPDAIAPVVTVTPPAPAATSSGDDGSSSSSTSSSSTPSVVSSSAPSIIGVPAATGVAAGLTLGTTATSKVTATKAAVTKALKLASLKKQLATLKMTEKKLAAHHAAAKTLSVKHALAKQIAATRAAEKKIALKIALLK
jgi:hypothetical protein